MGTPTRRARRLRIVFVLPRKSETRLNGREVQIAKIANILGYVSPDEVVNAAIDLLSLAADVAEKHGADKVLLGTAEELSTIFSDPDE